MDLKPEYNILCAIYYEKKRNEQWFCLQDVSGTAKITHCPEEGDHPAINMINFNGREGKVLDLNEGLDGTAVVILVQGLFDNWVLYTDIPVNDSTTSEELRQRVVEYIKKW